MAYFTASAFALMIVVTLYARVVSRSIPAGSVSSIPLYYIVFFFVLAPITHVLTGTYISDFAADAERSLLLANMALFNCLGLALAIASFRLFRLPRTKIGISVNPRILRNVTFIAFLIAFSFGLYTAVSTNFGNSIRFDLSGESYGILYFMIFESSPVLFTWFVVGYFKASNRNISGLGLIFVVLIICLLSILFCGLRGSRVAVVVQILSSLIILHLALRHIGTRFLALVFVSAVPFFILFGIYKAGGYNALSDFFERGYVSVEVARTIEPSRILVGDFGRSDVQAVVLDRVLSEQYSPTFRGETYLHALSLVLPQSLRPSIRDKREIGTEVQFGAPRMGDVDGRPVYSSRIYGGAGEALLNFGVLGGLLFFVLFGFLHSYAVNLVDRMNGGALMLVSPLLVLMPIYLLFYDLDNIIFQLIRTWLAPCLLLMLVSFLSSSAWLRMQWCRDRF